MVDPTHLRGVRCVGQHLTKTEAKEQMVQTHGTRIHTPTVFNVTCSKSHSARLKDRNKKGRQITVMLGDNWPLCKTVFLYIKITNQLIRNVLLYKWFEVYKTVYYMFLWCMILSETHHLQYTFPSVYYKLPALNWITSYIWTALYRCTISLIYTFIMSVLRSKNSRYTICLLVSLHKTDVRWGVTIKP